ncbi:MAG: ABC transporter ATP-binding protein [Desulfatiglans sp.]|jgi:NitT/TauT family transport system ATP-binding protein|nr:ABC transporter ATP-binding protein [Thermodesulfobacteriota bacterium]MEE4354811.1 ABC transporter ATP-binding protein [Desulfatiglans sp.]
MIVECRDISKIYLYPKEHMGRYALRDVTISVEEKEFVCIIGPNGCGKSTLLHMIAGLEKPTQGRILVHGRPLNGPSPNRGVVFQEPSLFPWQSVLGNIGFGLKAQGVPRRDRDKISRHYLDLVGLRGFDHARPHELSGGMRQKAAIARTLALEPDILLMDEPFGSLDEQTKLRLDVELLNIWKEEKRTVIFVTHSIEEAILLADRIVLLTERPGTIQKQLILSMPRPRNLFDPGVSKIRQDLLEHLIPDCPTVNQGISEEA